MARRHANRACEHVSTEFYQTKPESSPERYPLGCYSTRRAEIAHAATMKMRIRKCVRTCACGVAPSSTASLDTAKIIRGPGGAHSVRMQCTCGAPVGHAARRAGRAMCGKCTKNRMQGGGGASVKHCA